jgi:radical SAM protein with 4Fe4S-binding SPASM domain
MRATSLGNGTAGKRKLAHIDLEVTRKCNLSCIHCSASEKERGEEMPIKTVKKLLKEAISIGLERVGLTGGEPFLCKEKLMQIGNFCRNELNIPIHIHSNGTRITSQEAEWIRQTDAEITIPFYGDTATIHDSITNKKGSFQSTFDGLRNLVNIDANVCVYIVPMKQNLHMIRRLIEFVYAEGVSSVRVLSLSPTGRAKTRFEQLELSTKETEKLNADLLGIQKNLKMNLSAGFCTSQNFKGLSILKGHEQCFAAENRIHIDAFGNVFPCTASSGWISLSGGNLQSCENSLTSIWTTSPLLQFFRNFHRNPPKKCSGCKRYNNCMSGCRVKMLYKYNDVSIADPICRGPYN